MTLKRIDKNILYIISPWTFDKDKMKWYNVVNPQKIMNWGNLYKELLHHHSYNADLSITRRKLELIK